jgi:uncharacterized integral membrane protein
VDPTRAWVCAGGPTGYPDDHGTAASPGATDRPAWPAATTGDDPVVVRKNSFGQTLRTIIATVILVAVVAIAIANTDRVNLDLLFQNYDVSLSALVGGAAGAGFLIGALLGLGRGRRHRA